MAIVTFLKSSDMRNIPANTGSGSGGSFSPTQVFRETDSGFVAYLFGTFANTAPFVTSGTVNHVLAGSGSNAIAESRYY